MARGDTGDTIFVGQRDFGGGMNALDPGENQYREGINIAIRDRMAKTRPAVRRSWPSAASGVVAGFFFNDDGEKFNDATHTGFWFDFDFIRDAWTLGTIQGAEVIRFVDETEETILFVVDGQVYRHREGFAEAVASQATLTSTETITFTQGVNEVIMWRDESTDPQVWDGTATGFVAFGAPVGDSPPQASSGIFQTAGRMWAFRNRSDVFASDVLDNAEWDNTNQSIGVRSGDRDELTALVDFREDIILAFKRRSVSAITGVNAIVAAGEELTDHIQVQTVDPDAGLVGGQAVVIVGEDAWYLGFNGINSLHRNIQNNIQRDPVPMSAPIQPYIDRINWGNSTALEGAQAETFNNYVYFAVPIDGSSQNNALLVYDLLAGPHKATPEGELRLGAWCGMWTGDQLRVQYFLKFKDELRFMGYDGVVRTMGFDVPNDSDEVFNDALLYDDDTLYKVGDVVKYPTVSTTSLYEAIAPGSGNIPTDTDFWGIHADPEHAFDIQSKLKTRLYRVDDLFSETTLGRGEVLLKTRNPTVTIDMVGEDYNTRTNIITASTYSQVAYEVNNKADWDPTNVNLDFSDPYREDYTWLNTDTGMYIGEDGVDLGVWETKNVPFIVNMVSNRAFGFEIVNTGGQLGVQSVGVPVRQRRFAAKKAV